MKMVKTAIAVVGLLAFATGCSTTQKGAGAGAVIGGVAGAIIGHQSGHGVEGAAIGAGVGASGFKFGGRYGDNNTVKGEAIISLGTRNNFRFNDFRTTTDKE